MKLATMIRPRYFSDSIVAQLVSVSAFSRSLDPKRKRIKLDSLRMMFVLSTRMYKIPNPIQAIYRYELRGDVPLSVEKGEAGIASW